MKRITTITIISLLLLGSCSPTKNETDKSGSGTYILPVSSLAEYEQNIDHAALIARELEWDKDWAMRNRATSIYRTTCYSCHGNNEQPGSLPNSNKFWKDEFKNGADPYSMYQTVTRGFGQMPPHPQLVPSQKYDVIAFIRQVLIKAHNPGQYIAVDTTYLVQLPKGDSLGPEPKPYHPWADLDYGNWLIRCYEIADSDDPPKHISGGRAPLANEDYSQVNFAYKGIAMRLDAGPGGVAAGNTFAVFDHDLMRLAGVWTGEGFIDWEDILLDDQHNVYPRTVGDLQFANPVSPGWANPHSGSFEDPRIHGMDGRQYGPLPKKWTHYKGLYRHDDRIIIQYSLDKAMVMESYDLVEAGEKPVIRRTINMEWDNYPIKRPLKLRVAPDDIAVTARGIDRMYKEKGYWIAEVGASTSMKLDIFMSTRTQSEVDAIAKAAPGFLDLEAFTKGSSQKYTQTLTSPIIQGNDDDPYAVDVLAIPDNNPWKSRIRLTGIDFLKGGEEAVVSTIDGEVWRVEGITQSEGQTTWHRIATGMFQPLGIKVKEGDIYVSCRNEIVKLHDLNGNGETDFYESFNNDHQVTEHFHEFAMGLQTDEAGNFYYAKSSRHARTSLVPQHGTLIKVSADGSESEILANGFRAANGVCINPDGSFFVTDQQGYWNPMNRINRVTQGGFYGNIWGYGAPADSSDTAMEQPLMWVDMKYDRSPSELLWADSDRWGPLNGSLLNLSYGYGKIFVLMPQEVKGRQQAGMVELPVPQFPTGIMRARFNPVDGQMYVCGMSAWATSRMIQVGGLYRVRYTGKDLHLPVQLKATTQGVKLTFASALEATSATDLKNFEVNTWDIKRTRSYGSKRYNEKRMKISELSLSDDGKSLMVYLPDIKPSWIMEIKYKLKSRGGVAFEGAVQNTVYDLEGGEL